MSLLKEETGWDTVRLINLLILIMVSSGVFGFVYELLFYRIDTGKWTKRGSTFGPWIPIYVFGGAAYTFLVYPFKDNPLLVFILCVTISGIIEYATGWVLYEAFHIRLWDYNTEIWNWGNIGGYVCLRSILLFAFAGVFLIYIAVPAVRKLAGMIPKPGFYLIGFVPGVLFLIDIIGGYLLRIR